VNLARCLGSGGKEKKNMCKKHGLQEGQACEKRKKKQTRQNSSAGVFLNLAQVTLKIKKKMAQIKEDKPEERGGT